MNHDFFSSKWDQIKDKVQKKWNKLTDDDMSIINGNKDQLIEKLQERYGWDEDRTEKEIDQFEHAWEGPHKKEKSSKREELKHKEQKKVGQEERTETWEEHPKKRKIG